MYNLRYHLITVVSIFFSLALGLLLGAAIGGSEAFRQTSSSLVENLRQDYNKVSLERDKLKTELERDDKLSYDFIKYWTRGRLEHKTLLLITDSHSTAAREHIDEVVKLAGAHLVKLVINYDGIQALSDSEKEALQDVLKTVQQDNKKAASFKLSEALAQHIAYEVKAGALLQATLKEAQIAEKLTDRSLAEKPGDGAAEDQTSASSAAQSLSSEEDGAQKHQGVAQVLPYLIDKKLVTVVDAPQEPYQLDAVIDIALTKDASSHELGLALTASFAQLKIPGVLTQFNGRDKQLLIDAQTRGFSGVASCDSMIGSYSLIALLTGGQPGVYGVEGAKPYPSLPEDKKSLFTDEHTAVEHVQTERAKNTGSAGPSDH